MSRSDKQCAFDELAAVEAGENAFAPEIKMLGLKAFAPDNAFFWRPTGAHFPVALSLISIAFQSSLLSALLTYLLEDVDDLGQQFLEEDKLRVLLNSIDEALLDMHPNARSANAEGRV